MLNANVIITLIMFASVFISHVDNFNVLLLIKEIPIKYCINIVKDVKFY